MALQSRVLSGSCVPYETDARASRKRETDWVGYVRRVGAYEIPA
jgi:hypothetical protein